MEKDVPTKETTPQTDKPPCCDCECCKEGCCGSGCC